MLRRLQAEEQLIAISVAALGGGNVKRHEARRALWRLERLAQGGRQNAIKATPQMLAAMGIAVIEQPAAQAEVKDV